MRYQMYYNNRGERIWLPLLAGAAIITAPFWLGGRQCCQNNYQQPYPYQPYPTPYPYPYPVMYPYPEPIPYQVPYPTYIPTNNIN